MTYQLGCQVWTSEVESTWGGWEWTEKYKLSDLNITRPKWGWKTFRVQCPLCGKKLKVLWASWVAKISFALLGLAIYAFGLPFYDALFETTAPKLPFYLFGAFVLWIWVVISLSPKPTILYLEHMSKKPHGIFKDVPTDEERKKLAGEWVAEALKDVKEHKPELN